MKYNASQFLTINIYCYEHLGNFSNILFQNFKFIIFLERYTIYGLSLPKLAIKSIALRNENRPACTKPASFA